MALKKTTKKDEPGLLLNFTTKNPTGFAPELVQIAEAANGARNYRTYLLSGRQSLLNISGIPAHVKELLQGFTLDNQAQHAGLLPNVHQLPDLLLEANEEQVQKLHQLYYSRLKQLQLYLGIDLPLLCSWEKEIGITYNYRKVQLSKYTPRLSFKITQTERELALECWIKINHELYPLQDFQRQHFFLKERSELFMLAPEDGLLLNRLAQQNLRTPTKQKKRFLEQVVNPLRETYEVDDTAIAETATITAAPEHMVKLSELGGDFLMITPAWKYDWYETDATWQQETVTTKQDNIVYTIHRDLAEENKFRDTIRSAHPDFARQTKEYFYLKTTDALKKGWFYHFYNQLQAQNIMVHGAEQLKQFRYTTHKAEVTISITGNIDWFDILVEVKFGDYIVPLADLRHALLHKQQYVVLKDGTLGILPGDFYDQYGLLLKMGQAEKNNLRLSKYHWSMLEQLEAVQENKTLQQSFAHKRALLEQTDFTKRYPLPNGIRAQLRDYQLAGYQWLCLLHELQWGACLADDMGLGKTLQTICFLQYLIQQQPGATHLVVCPTSLIFNWQKELEKFAPGIRFHLYYGNDRVLDAGIMKNNDVIITSYGCMRGDIETLQHLHFGCVVLDESHAIKNPAAQAARATLQLQAGHRVTLSGTPVQNNTYDLYAQMNFMNPGLLGSRDFFKQQFATPIDKYGDANAGRELQKLVYPFILRRTKEQVAKDLPDKTETILWCEMEAEQRKIYDSFKDHYRSNLLGKIDHDGMSRSSIAILEGLTRLRQVCNSPAIIQNDVAYPDVSIKKDELVREIEDNIGGHKALVFSQFTSMLRLVAQALEEKDIEYIYLDGSTPATERQALVEKFQQDDTIRVFLISLKAGGVGLTLTAADYVYLIDPWWNPAAEAQAIDRTHRIGQTQKVFAYKMICRDTVEEKILQLQQKKKTLGDALITEESGFVKKLTRDDVAFLFS